MAHQDYDFSAKKFATIVGLLFAVVTATTLLYGAIMGFDRHGVAVANSTIIKAAICPPTAGQFLCRIHGAVGAPYANSFGYPSCPVCGQPMACQSMASTSSPPLTTVAAG